jgi:hypothetical protein
MPRLQTSGFAKVALIIASGTVEPCRAFQVPTLSLGDLVEIEDREIEPDKGPSELFPRTGSRGINDSRDDEAFRARYQAPSTNRGTLNSSVL